jgi:uncharacterized heparinase superfamily protein
LNLSFARNVKSKAGKLACNSFLYNWSLGGCIPDKVDFNPVDPWPGDSGRGRWLCSGAFDIDGERLELHGDFWEPLGISQSWFDHMHGFEWLRDLKALGGDAARRQAGSMIESWINCYPSWEEKSWRPDLIGMRLSSWLAFYDFFGPGAGDSLHNDFLDSVIRQTRHLSRTIGTIAPGIPAFYACRGLLFSGTAFSGYEHWKNQALERLELEIETQILSDGGHVSRSPENILKLLQILLDTRCALLSTGGCFPEKIQHAIDRMCPALRFFRHTDKHLSLFNGGREGAKETIDAVLVHANAKGKALRSLPECGFEKITQGRSVLIADAGNIPKWPYDREAHSAPMAFEFAHGRERIFVNCGSHPTSEEWQDVLRSTAAHNALCLNYRNACEIKEDGHFGRKPRTVTVDRQETEDACLLDMSHDGYVPLNGISYRRRLYLSEKGGSLCGEETLNCITGLGKTAEVAVRFHLHPRVRASLTQDRSEAIISLPSGSGWRFFNRGGELAIEDSVYLGSGARPFKTLQIVIYGEMAADFAQIKWRLEKQKS